MHSVWRCPAPRRAHSTPDCSVATILSRELVGTMTWTDPEKGKPAAHSYREPRRAAHRAKRRLSPRAALAGVPERGLEREQEGLSWRVRVPDLLSLAPAAAASHALQKVVSHGPVHRSPTNSPSPK
ncbi:hypothetical protein VTJ04DRAFT_5515 [Mycothermus thermophilus]|uniref:uncharacterized protein n=1 Tax=Humicola insolens TaxID=85995 RepID=UPI003742E74D